MHAETVWSFKTARFVVRLDVEPDDSDPADHFEFPEDVEFADEGGWHWFSARVVVTLDGHEIGSSDLGGCSYDDGADFYASHRDADPMNRNCSIMRAGRGQNVVICHYFPGMVSEAVRIARETLRGLGAVYVRPEAA